MAWARPLRFTTTTKDEEIEYHLVTSEEIGRGRGKISTTSPIGRALLNKKVGDTAMVVTPNGKREMEILSLTTMHDEADGARMTWTSAFGRACGVLLDAIVRWLALARINPNVLTFFGLVVNTIAAFLFGYANGDNQATHVFLRRACHHRLRILRPGGRTRRARH